MSETPPAPKLLPHADEPGDIGKDWLRIEKPASHTVFRLLDTPIRGPRSGLYIPVRVVWRPRGKGLFMLVRPATDGGASKVVLYPQVEYKNAKGQIRREDVADWIGRGGAVQDPATVAPPSPSTTPTP